MYKLQLLLLSILVVNLEALHIDPMSIRVIPDLYRLCWKQLNGKPPASLSAITLANQIMHFKVINETTATTGSYCIENREAHVFYNISLQLYDGIPPIQLKVKFSMRLGPVLPVIRKKLVASGFYLQLDAEFGGITVDTQPICYGIMEYTLHKKPIVTNFEIDTTSNKFQKLDPATSFRIYYYCNFVKWLPTSSSFISDEGSSFPPEEFESIQPFIQFPFKRFLVTQWKNPNNIPNHYSLAIYENSISKGDICLKIFRLHIRKSDQTKTVLTPSNNIENCNKNVIIEDLGYSTMPGDGNTHVVLDMVETLKINTKYKLSIFWLNPYGELMKQFIYFEAMLNENSGMINPSIYNYNRSTYRDVRNQISSIRQNFLSLYNENPITEFKLMSNTFHEMFILPSVSMQLSSRFPVVLTPFDIEQRCKSSKDCTSGLYPFYYVAVTRLTPSGTFVELLQLVKMENRNLKVHQLKFTPDGRDNTFTLSWSTIAFPETIIPGLYAVIINNHDADKCHAVYILKCRTCNQVYKKISEKNSQIKINEWKRDCGSVYLFEDHYDLWNSEIVLRTKSMPSIINFNAEVFAINNHNVSMGVKSKVRYIRDIFWVKYGYIVISVICTIIGFAIVLSLFLWCVHLAKDIETGKDKETEDSNKYYGEDDV